MYLPTESILSWWNDTPFGGNSSCFYHHPIKLNQKLACLLRTRLVSGPKDLSQNFASHSLCPGSFDSFVLNYCSNLLQVTVTFRDGKVKPMANIYIRGSKIRFLILPDMLKNAPMFKAGKQAKPGAAGRGKSGILKMQAARGRGRGGPPQRGGRGGWGGPSRGGR